MLDGRDLEKYAVCSSTSLALAPCRLARHIYARPIYTCLFILLSACFLLDAHFLTAAGYMHVCLITSIYGTIKSG